MISDENAERHLERIKELNEGKVSLEYEEGFMDGYDYAKQDAGTCGECKHYEWALAGVYVCRLYKFRPPEEHFCARFKRKQK